MIQQRLRRLEILVERLAAALRGQMMGPPRRLQTAQDVIGQLEEQVEALRSEAGAGTVEKDRAIGYLTGIARKAIETGDLAARLEKLEAAQAQPGRGPRC
jgi:hypothetical protein